LASAKLEAVQIEAQAIVDEAQSEREEALKEIERLEREECEREIKLKSAFENCQELEEYKAKIEKELFTDRATAKATIDGLEARLQDAKEAMENMTKISETPKKRIYKKKPE
jgi:chromosome segregation ATPase